MAFGKSYLVNFVPSFFPHSHKPNTTEQRLGLKKVATHWLFCSSTQIHPPPLSPALCPQSLSTWLNDQNYCWFSFCLPSFWLPWKEPWVEEDSQTLKIGLYLIHWLRQWHCFCIWIHLFGFLSAGIVLTSSLALPQVNIFKLYLTLIRFPSGWQPVLFQPGTKI